MEFPKLRQARVLLPPRSPLPAQVQPVLARGGSLARGPAVPTARTHVPLMEEGVPKMEPTAAQKTWSTGKAEHRSAGVNLKTLLSMSY